MSNAPLKKAEMSTSPNRKRPRETALDSHDASTAASIMTRFTNCLLVRGDELVIEDLWVQDGVVVDPKARFLAAASAEEFVDGGKIIDVDCGGAYVAPGFIDVQINGAFGIDFADPANMTAEKLAIVANGLLAHGVVGFLPTIVSSSSAVYTESLALFRKAQQALRQSGNRSGASVLGLHLEGPFMNPAKKGAHKLANLRDPVRGMASVKETYGPSLEGVALVTLSPELPGALETIDGLTQQGVVVSMGHTMATMKEGLAGRRAGALLITHLFNAMPSFHHRDPGLVGLLGAAEEEDRPYYSLIADGLHCHTASIKIATRSHPKGAVLVTDAIAAMGLGNGDHSLGEQKVTVTDGIKATLTGTDTLAGACVPMAECCRNFMAATQCSVPEVVAAASSRPARVVFGESTLVGTLEAGAPADLVVLGGNLEILDVYLGGSLAWTSRTT